MQKPSPEKQQLILAIEAWGVACSTNNTTLIGWAKSAVIATLDFAVPDKPTIEEVLKAKAT